MDKVKKKKGRKELNELLKSRTSRPSCWFPEERSFLLLLFTKRVTLHQDGNRKTRSVLNSIYFLHLE